MQSGKIPVLLVLCMFSVGTSAEEASWIKGKATPKAYSPHKVVYSISTRNMQDVTHILVLVNYAATRDHSDPSSPGIILVLQGNNTLYQQASVPGNDLTAAAMTVSRICQPLVSGLACKPGPVHGFMPAVRKAATAIRPLQWFQPHEYGVTVTNSQSFFHNDSGVTRF